MGPRHSADQFESAVAAWNIGLFTLHLCSGELLASRRFQTLYGLKPAERHSSDALLERVHPADRFSVSQLLDPTGERENWEPIDVVHRIIENDGKSGWVHIRASLSLEESQPVLRGSAMEVTERMQVEQKLRQTQTRFEQAVRTSQLGVFEHDHVEDPNGEDVYWSPEQRKLLGVTDDVPGGVATFCSLVHPDDLSLLVETATRAHEPSGDGFYDVEHRIIRPDGKLRWIRTRSFTYFKEVNGQRTLLRTVGAMLDITDQKEANDALRRQAAILDATPDFVAIAKPNMEIVYLNRAARSFLGLSERDDASERHMRDAHTSASFDELLGQGIETAFHRGSWSGQLNFLRHDASEVPMSQVLLAHSNEDGRVVRYSTIARDLSRERALEENVRQAQKMEAVGRLAGGVAHDFNNILSVIIGFASIAADNLFPTHPGQAALDEVIAAAERAAELTGQLLAFSRKQVFRKRIVDVNSTLNGMGAMIRRLVGETIFVRSFPSTDRACVEADPSHLEQIFLNLSVNAKDAMPSGGRLTLKVECVEVESNNPPVTDVPAGQYVVIAVQDTGCGMTAATRSQVFEPFFTTKHLSQGTGLGLATVFGIAKQSGGGVQVESQLGAGATFRVYLPRSTESESSLEVQVPRLHHNRGEVILLAEDDVQLRAVLATVLNKEGYTTLTASGPIEALALADKFSGRIDLLITDVVMPDMNGVELANALASRRGPLPVLYMSGYANVEFSRNEPLGIGQNFVSKPLSPDQLLAAVDRVLNAPDRSIGDEA